MPTPWLEEGCPWYALHVRLTPDIEWCEAARCALITEPANTWSNLAYVALGLWVTAASRGERGLGRAWGPVMVFMGACSFGYHASANFIGQLMDFVGMFAFMGLPFALNLRRLGLIREAQALPVYLSVVAAASLAVVGLYLLQLPVQPTIFVFVSGTLLMEVGLLTRRESTRFAPLWVALGTLILALFVRELDRQRIACDPTHPLLQGHAAWHVLSAFSVTACWRFYSQFRPQADTET